MIDTEQLDTETLLLRPGRVLDNNNAHEVMQAVDAALKDGKRYVVCDMTSVDFLSSAGVGSLISGLSKIRGNGGEFVLFNLSEKILHVLQALDLQDFMPCEADLETAVARCRSGKKSDSAAS